jgi:Uma2 family endonuclease
VETTHFDPLVDLHGMWTTELAEKYLPIPGEPRAKYECVDGHLTMSPYEGHANGFGMLRLAELLAPPAREAGYRVYPTVNVRFADDRWIQPDLTVITRPGDDDVWVPTENVVIVGEFLSPSSQYTDTINKPRLCAEAGIPFYLLAEVSRRRRFASVRLDRLVSGKYRTIAEARAGELFEVAEPVKVSFDPIKLLDIS